MLPSSRSPGLVDVPLVWRLISKTIPDVSTRETPITSFKTIVYEHLPPSVLWKSNASFLKIMYFVLQIWSRFLFSLTLAQPSLIILTPPSPSKLLCDRARGRAIVDPEYVDVAVRVIGDVI